MSSFSPGTFRIRPAELSDLDACLAFDAAYTTDFAWQMETQADNGQVNVSFRCVHLPRSMRVLYPRDARQLTWNWQRCEGFWVAELDSKVVAYAALTLNKDQGVAGLTDLVVERHYRRRGLGTALVKAALDWSRNRRIKRLMAELQTKNYPGICFYQKMGFAFCGFNDHYYVNQDIAIFFVLGLR